MADMEGNMSDQVKVEVKRNKQERRSSDGEAGQKSR